VAELGVHHVEVVGGDAAVGLVEGKGGRPAGVVTPRGREDGLELLGDADGHHAGARPGGSRCEVELHCSPNLRVIKRRSEVRKSTVEKHLQ
jgi:hypothetical protein